MKKWLGALSYHYANTYTHIYMHHALISALRASICAEVILYAHNVGIHADETAQEISARIVSEPDSVHFVNINPRRKNPIELISLNRAGNFRSKVFALSHLQIMGVTLRIEKGEVRRYSSDEFNKDFARIVDHIDRTPELRAERIFEEGMKHRDVRSYKGRVGYKESARLLGYNV